MNKNTKEKNIKKSTISPLGNRVLVRPMSLDEVRGESKNKHFGIIVPDSILNEKSAQGVVIAVGPGEYVDGKLIPIEVKVGDIVIYSKYSYDEVQDGDVELYLLKSENLLAVIK